MKSQLSGITALVLSLALSSPASASDWTVEFTNNFGQSVWVFGLDDLKATKVSNKDTHNVKWSEDGCPPSYAIGYLTVYAKEDTQNENAIVTAEYKYNETKNSCKLYFYTSDWYNGYNDSYTTVDKGTNKNHKRKLTLKPK